ncbi:MAG: hypothetical protein ABSG02_04040 [Terriglobales bacterium]
MAQRMKSEDGVEALVLAGTELPLLLRDTASPGIEFLDTTIIHVEAIVQELLK